MVCLSRFSTCKIKKNTNFFLKCSTISVVSKFTLKNTCKLNQSDEEYDPCKEPVLLLSTG